MKTRCIFVATIVASLAANGAQLGSAQDFSSNESLILGRLMQQQEDESQSRGQTTSELGSLIEMTQRLRNRLDDFENNQSGIGAAELQPVAPSAPLPEINQPPQDDFGKSLRDIRSKLEVLRSIRSRKPPVTENDSVRPESIPATDVSPNPDSTTEPATAPAAVTDVADGSSSDAQSPIDSAIESKEGQQLLPVPADQLALGESLYRTGEFGVALKTLKAIDTNTLSQSDGTWVALLIAMCQRRIGDIDNSTANMREIANASAKDYHVPTAQFLLQQSELMQTSKPTFDQINQELDAQIMRAKTYVGQ